MKIPGLPPFKFTGVTLVNAVGVLIVLYLVVVLVGTVKRNYDLGRQIDGLRAQIDLLESQKQQLADSIQYYQTDSFRDREARAKLGLQLPGENVVIIPRATPAPAPQTGTKTAKTKSNFQQWLDFLIAR